MSRSLLPSQCTQPGAIVNHDPAEEEHSKRHPIYEQPGDPSIIIVASFAWAPPLSTEPRDADDLLAGPESISPDDIAIEFTALEVLKGLKKFRALSKLRVKKKPTKIKIKMIKITHCAVLSIKE
ncbi:hypothetical protein F4604DRAFT_1929786 [Suillus subluteus]|nr:hypothetical protein F4604DRAFT_1929786 [Suillus subluteus]